MKDARMCRDSLESIKYNQNFCYEMCIGVGCVHFGENVCNMRLILNRNDLTCAQVVLPAQCMWGNEL